MSPSIALPHVVRCVVDGAAVTGTGKVLLESADEAEAVNAAG